MYVGAQDDTEQITIWGSKCNAHFSEAENFWL